MAFGIGLALLYLETEEAKRQQIRRSGANARPGSHVPDTAWQARIDVALALPNPQRRP